MIDKSSINILYVEDDETIGFLTRDNLEMNGYIVTLAKDGKSALELFKDNSYQICILDIMLPEIDGFELATRIRKLDRHIPILFLSAKSMVDDRIRGLRLGADDYITKPFSMKELLLRIEVFLKRSRKYSDEDVAAYRLGNLIFDFNNQSVTFGENNKTDLTLRESELLRYFIENSNRILKREEILMSIWGNDDYFLGRSLDVFISRLRKIFKDEPSVTIQNIHGVGFRFQTE